MKNLTWNVFVEDSNRKEIKTYNVLNAGIMAEIRKRTKNIKKKADFEAEVKSILMYYYWSKCEWEIILTSWPTRISIEELNRLKNELKEYVKTHNKVPYILCPRLNVAEKIDVFRQIEINWDIFIDYLWNNL